MGIYTPAVFPISHSCHQNKVASALQQFVNPVTDNIATARRCVAQSYILSSAQRLNSRTALWLN
jgi:hypothetical protein